VVAAEAEIFVAADEVCQKLSILDENFGDGEVVKSVGQTSVLKLVPDKIFEIFLEIFEGGE